MAVITLNGGLRADVGLFSLLDGLKLADAKAAMIDVDVNCFETLIVGVVGMCVAACVAALRVKPFPVALPLVCSIATIAAIFVDTRFSPDIVSALMQTKGYQRCRAGDHIVHSYRANVYFQRYVSDARNCSPVARSS